LPVNLHGKKMAVKNALMAKKMADETLALGKE
jgi:hypothetical protein